jgi:hypothetical protein
LFRSVIITKYDVLLFLGVVSKLKEKEVWNMGWESGFVIQFNLFVIIIHFLFRFFVFVVE